MEVPSMFAVISVPQFPLQALLRGQSQATPAVVVDDEVTPKRRRGKPGQAPVVAINPQASVTGVHLGMTAPQAQARCAGVRVLTRDRVEEAAVYRALLDHAWEHCADLEATGPGLITIDLYGCRRWHRDWKAFGQSLCRSLGRELRLDLVMGMAPTPDQARLAAESIAGSGPVVRVVEGDASAAFGGESIHLLHPSAALLEVFHLWGIGTVGQFLTLPRDGVGERLGAEAAALWDLVRGGRKRLLRLVRPPASYEHAVSLDYELETLEPLLFLLRRGLEVLTARLGSQYLVASQIQVTLPLADGTRVTETFRVPDPTSDVDLLFRIVHRRFETLEAKSPVTGLTLALTPSQPQKRQHDFFRAALTDPNRFAHTLAELESLLGSDRVGRPRALGTHRPDAFVLEPFDRSIESATQVTSSQGTREDVMLGLPLRRCRPPVMVRVATQPGNGAPRPVRLLDGPCPGPVIASRGPWKASGQWWDPGAWMREEWDVALDQGLLCQLVRQDQVWYLEGLYG